MLALAITAAAHAAPAGGNVFLYLDKALRGGAGTWEELELEFPLRDGAWPDAGWGYATWFHRGHHLPRILKNVVDGNVRRLSVEMDVGPDNWGPGGWAEYDIDVTRDGDRFTGSFTGKFWPGGPVARGARATVAEMSDSRTAAQACATGWRPDRALKDAAAAIETQGTVRGHIGPAWPGAVTGHKPPLPGEHPRLAFRKADIPLLRQRAAETPEGKAILARALAYWARARVTATSSRPGRRSATGSRTS